MHRFATHRAHLIVTRSFIHNGRVVVSDVGDVGSLINNRHIALRRQERLLNPRRAEFATGDEGILIGPDVVIIIRPIMDPSALIESCFRRQRRPADVLAALAP